MTFDEVDSMMKRIELAKCRRTYIFFFFVYSLLNLCIIFDVSFDAVKIPRIPMKPYSRFEVYAWIIDIEMCEPQR